MYAFPSMLELTGQEWPSDAHKKVAETALLCNGRYHNLTDLKEGARIIAEIPDDKIKLVTAMDLYALGIMLP
jgi:hypothetical protein